jgi:hypothetical protein
MPCSGWVVKGGLEPPTFRFSVRQRFSRYLAGPLPNNVLRAVSAVAGAICCGPGCGRLPASWRSDSWLAHDLFHAAHTYLTDGEDEV